MDTATIICDEGVFDFEFFESKSISAYKKEVFNFLKEENYHLKFPFFRCVINGKKFFIDLKGCE